MHGQESAPFELLVAVVVMTFVLLIGVRAMDELSKVKCKGEIEAELEELKTAIQTVATARGKQTFGLSIPPCFESEETTLAIRARDDPRVCAQYCGGGQTLCTLLVFNAATQYASWKCLKISPNTIFATTSSTCPPDEPGRGYTAVDLKGEQGIENGDYVLVGKFDVTSSVPVVCAYRHD